MLKKKEKVFESSDEEIDLNLEPQDDVNKEDN